jgi:hypothetical protein
MPVGLAEIRIKRVLQSYAPKASHRKLKKISRAAILHACSGLQTAGSNMPCEAAGLLFKGTFNP